MLEDAAIGLVVKILGPNDERYFVANMGQQQNAAQDGLFRIEIARRLAIENFGGNGGFARRLGARFAIDGRHDPLLRDTNSTARQAPATRWAFASQNADNAGRLFFGWFRFGFLCAALAAGFRLARFCFGCLALGFWLPSFRRRLRHLPRSARPKPSIATSISWPKWTSTVYRPNSLSGPFSRT